MGVAPAMYVRHTAWMPALSLSCSQVDRLVALARMRQSGAFLSTSEALILQLVRDAAHPQFKEVMGPLGFCD